VDEFDLDQPVLGDRGWGYWLASDSLGTGFAYPSIIVVAPDGEVLSVQAGYSDWSQLGQTIRAHAQR
jgi:hypothetical protein